MSTCSERRILTYLSDGAIPNGCVVKFGSDKKHVAKATAATNLLEGIAQGQAADAAEQSIEVALPGGGALALAGGVIAAGDRLTSDGNGALIATTTTGNYVIAIAMEAAVSGDIFSVEVVNQKQY